MSSEIANDRFAKQNMITWRKKRMVIQQFLSDLFKPSAEEVKSKKYRPIIYAIGDVNFKSTGKGEKGGAPIAKIGIELKSKIKQGKEDKILAKANVITENENYTTQKHYAS